MIWANKQIFLAVRPHTDKDHISAGDAFFWQHPFLHRKVCDVPATFSPLYYVQAAALYILFTPGKPYTLAGRRQTIIFHEINTRLSADPAPFVGDQNNTHAIRNGNISTIASSLTAVGQRFHDDLRVDRSYQRRLFSLQQRFRPGDGFLQVINISFYSQDAFFSGQVISSVLKVGQKAINFTGGFTSLFFKGIGVSRKFQGQLFFSLPEVIKFA